MTENCDDKSCEVDLLRDNHSHVLKIVLAINAAMFFIEGTAGYLARSTALMADSLDMLGDALAYGLSLYVLGRGEKWNAMAALFKGGLMALLGILILSQAVFKMLHPSLPVAEAMGLFGGMAMMANLTCLALLWKSKTDDLNMNSVWLCSRNDFLANSGVLASAVAVKLTHSGWPDILIGLAIAAVILKSSIGVIHRAYSRLQLG